MAANLTPYLNFAHGAREVMDRYEAVFGGALSRMTFGESGMGTPADADKVMHSQLEIGPGMTIMASDVPEEMGEPGPNGTVALSGGPAEADDLRRWFEGLADGGTVTAPLVTAPWGDTFGMCTDRFGVTWLVNIGNA